MTTACTETRPQPDLTGQDVRLTIIHTADIHGRLFPYTFVPNTFDQGYGLLPVNAPFGGIARVTTLVKRIRASTNRALWLDSGDAFEGAPVFNEFHGEAELRALSAAGLEGAVLGNHEFDLGTPNLYSKVNTWSRYPIFTCNYAWDPLPGQPSLGDLVEPFQIYNVQGVKVGVIGMGNTDTLLGSFQGGNTLGFRAIDDAPALEQYVRLLRPMVDVIVVVSHLGLDNDEGLSPSEVDDPNAALPLQGIDLILGGHLHIVTNPSKILANDDGIMYCETNDCRTVFHSGAFAKYVGRLICRAHGHEQQRSRAAQPHHVVHVHQPAGRLARARRSGHRELDVAVLGAGQRGHRSQRRVRVRRRAAGRHGHSAQRQLGRQLGNLVARSMQLQQGVEAEFALTNSLGIRDDFYPGALTNEQMYNVFLFREHDRRDVPVGHRDPRGRWTSCRSASRRPRLPHAGAGRRHHVRHGVPRQQRRVRRQDRLDDRSAGDRVRAEHLPRRELSRGQSRQPGQCRDDAVRAVAATGLYRAAVNNYIAAGGSGFEVLKRNTSQQDTGVSLRVALTVYLKSVNPCDPSIIDTSDTTFPQRTIVTRYGNISCLDQTIEPHDGRIRPVFDPPAVSQ